MRGHSMTNFDKIKQELTKEKVAWYFITKVYCDFCPCSDRCKLSYQNHTKNCAKIIMEWLEEEV